MFDGLIYGESAPDLYVKFEAKAFAKPSVCWLNRHFWHKRSIDLSDGTSVERLKSHLLDQFGVSVPDREFHPASSFTSSVRTLYADRYGAPQGGLHGGSGRCGTVGTFNAKGIGRTPLCNMAKDWYHTHGCLWMEEAIREAIFSSIACDVFPNGAVPVVAIIDTGERISGLHGAEAGARRAIIIRPSPMRLAHLERSIFFETGGTPDSSQYRDALRVKQCLSIMFDSKDERDVATQLHAMFTAIGTQVGFGQAHRLFHGDYHSTNISVDGALIDFGAFRSVPSWKKQKWEDRGVYFGSEVENVARSIAVLLFQCSKNFPDNNLPSLPDLTHSLKSAADNSRHSEFSRIASCNGLIGEDNTREILEVIIDEYRYQQGLDPFGPATRQRAKKELLYTHSATRNRRISISKIESIVLRSVSSRDRAARAFGRILAWYDPLSSAFREVVQARANTFLSELFADPDRARSDRLISKYIDSSIYRIMAELRARSISSTDPGDLIRLSTPPGVSR